ncbi:MAG: hypothetical protein WCR41_04275, partial [Bacteroidales bacterium]
LSRYSKYLFFIYINGEKVAPRPKITYRSLIHSLSVYKVCISNLWTIFISDIRRTSIKTIFKADTNNLMI